MYQPLSTAEELADAEARLRDPKTRNHDKPYLRDRIRTLRAIVEAAAEYAAKKTEAA